ncbi:MAG TPA: nucleotidyltransferase, partial [Flavisolibacter sp.]|nr:nucleotidyltransferase [Flavisolibacter sp.]
LITINERLKLYRENGKIIYEDPEGGKHEVPEDAKTSMNFWCFHPSIFAYLEEEFKTFLDENINDLKAEFLIPSTADKYIKSGRGVLKVLPTNAQWFGVTYKEDAPIVTKSIKDLVDSGVYAAQLW